MAAEIRNHALLAALKMRGYHWMERKDARQLWSICGERAFKLPPWDDVGLMPGVAEGNIGSLVTVVNGMANRGRGPME